ncbi:MAG: bifunctional DedA family/phosphatase PAP2 family protein [Thermoleophilaceae bacterium]|nr:bifunctional DedA family/phosphatase PAP2 family protein [Thermoleophilaceae bacterium]
MKRIRENKGKVVLASVVAVVVVLYATGLTPDFPDPKKAIEDIAQALGPWTYALVGAAAFLETGAFIGLIAPGETTVIVGGVIAGQGEVDLVPMIGLVWVACVLGDTASFYLGRKLGRGFLLRHGPKLKIDEERLERVESYFERHGGKTILIGRFIGLVRAVSPFVAGSSGLAFRRFFPYSVIGCGLWGTIFTLLGFIFYRSFDRVAAIAGQAALGFAVSVGFVVGVVVAYRRLRDPEQRRRLGAWAERQARRPALRPLAAAVRPIWRRVIAPVVGVVRPRLHLLSDRLTPGELGLELTTVVAVAGVGAYVFALYTSIVSGDTASVTGGDRELLDLATDLRGDTATDAVGLITDLGSFTFVAALVLAAAMVLTARSRFGALGALIVGSLLTVFAVDIAKDAVDRPRPSNPLQSAQGSSFPSGHAAYSTIWVGVALVIARVMPGLVRDAVLVGLAVLVAVAIGLSRVYLRVHYWSDVAAGWGMGAAILGFVGAIALVVAHVRHNQDA